MGTLVPVSVLRGKGVKQVKAIATLIAPLSRWRGARTVKGSDCLKTTYSRF